jgi:hypothetical protein
MVFLKMYSEQQKFLFQHSVPELYSLSKLLFVCDNWDLDNSKVVKLCVEIGDKPLAVALHAYLQIGR